MKSQRDLFLELLLEKAKQDSSIVLLSVDMGAPAIDLWKRELPQQYLEMGISEQNAINVAAGLSRGGKKVFVYFMAVWVHRCFEQIRYSCCMSKNKITILGNGVGLGYAPAGPAHEPNEDFGVMRTLHHMRIYSASSNDALPEVLEDCLKNSESSYVRLERRNKEIPSSASRRVKTSIKMKNRVVCEMPNEKKLIILTYGYISHRIYEVFNDKPNLFSKAIIIELNQIWPIPIEDISPCIDSNSKILCVEEQSRSGSLMEAIAALPGISHRIYGLHLPSEYIFENGTQDELLDRYGLSREDIENKIQELL